MGKVIRPTYPAAFSAGLLLLIFVICFFLSHQVFTVPILELNENKSVYLGMFLVTCAIMVMLLIIWEEFLFPIKVKPIDGGVIFRNHRTKLIKQLLFYLTIPSIFTFIYMNYEVNLVRFIILAAVCIIAPVAEKLISGINNYNDFLSLTDDAIEYKNNQEEGSFELKTVQRIHLIKDDRKVLHKIQLILTDAREVMIDIDEMELEAFYASINEFITTHYKSLVKE